VTAPKDLQPFLAFIPQVTRPLGAALTALVLPEATSPWSPRVVSEAPAATGLSADELARLTEEARARGVADGLAETAALRAQLAEVIDQLVDARAAIVAPIADVIAEVCSCVIEGWIAGADRAALFAPVVRGWLAASAAPATARVHPDDAAALTALIGDAPIAIVSDAALAPGALAIRGAALEVTHDWRARLPELRAAIASALTPEISAEPAPAPAPAIGAIA
jgi:hypothetical protein